ncbi:hypothetical protein QFW96_04840 [Saccharopolyspora sp. TS4A08]|uniref:DUF1440 domain-containing protein n=1 Tax=Saccharopolyspora ipomoeae TaxID=3042027 RepID=A0ABT6PIT8_9PSEU|nr:hypothetical protein [Saccharopolyspora sp. TS4A08]MDI2027920.1 hypothetical protein [Saccharopolyspora sp. TS4A08]
MSATVHPAHPMQVGLSRALTGAVAGLGGGIVFGVLMAATGMLPMIAMLVGAGGAGVGVVVHLAISVILGAGFGLIAPSTRFWPLLAAGVAYGVLWWVLGGLLLMPAALGMPVLQLGATAMQSLMGHLIYGIVTAAVLFALRRRTAHA